MQTITLNNGIQMPALGMSTFMMTSGECESSVAQALRRGYRLIDTASAYGNEEAVGSALRRSGVERADAFLITKIWPRDYPAGDDPYSRTTQALDGALQRLGCDYIDQVLLHQPGGDYRSAWRALEDAVEEGKVRSIGLAYFQPDEVQTVLDMARVRPQVIEAECQPYNQSQALRQLCQTQDLQFVASLLLGGGNRTMLDDNTFWELGAKYGVSNVAAILRWLLQSGCVAIPKSPDPDSVLQGLDALDFQLEPDEMARINRLDRSAPVSAATHAPARQRTAT
ncbi:MAG: aldo/keto reductase [Atopobiaceae bacterium]